jgi:hypothetical protein
VVGFERQLVSDGKFAREDVGIYGVTAVDFPFYLEVGCLFDDTLSLVASTSS